MDAQVEPAAWGFGNFVLDRHTRALYRLNDGAEPARVQLGSRAFDILCILLGRKGEFVSKQEIMEAVWPNVVVADSNLTVQLSALRRILDAGRSDGGCIQTVPGRGYRFAEPVTVPVDPVNAGSAAKVGQPVADRAFPAARRVWLGAIVGACAMLAILLIAGTRTGLWFAPPAAPRFSLIVLPFNSLSTDPRDSGLASGITADLTNGLTRDMQATVASTAAANTDKGQAVDPRQIGDRLGVRYIVDGSVRQVGASLRVDVQLTSAESGTQLWSDQFDEAPGESEAVQGRVAVRLRTGLRDALIQIESARSQHDHPNDPDAFDLVLQARAVSLRSPSTGQQKQVLALYERALAADPSYVPALVGSAYFLIERQMPSWQTFADMRRAEIALVKAREIAPKAPEPTYVYMYWLKSVGRCPEVIELGQQFIHTGSDPERTHPGVYSQLGQCLAQTGHAEEDIALQNLVIGAAPDNPWMFWRYIAIGYDQLLLGRDHDAITSLQRAIALDPDMGTYRSHLLLAAAYARVGQLDAARQTLAVADRLWPYLTVRTISPNYSPSPVYHGQLTRLRDALRLAGERDHADENVDFGVVSDGALHNVVGRTPARTPGAVTISTAELPQLLADVKPLVIDTMANWWGASIPGAVGLKYAGLGGDFSDEAQDRLRLKMRDLTAGALDHPIVAVGWNSERFDGRNLALRLVALGYKHIYWYRGGLEAWEVAGLPEAELNVEAW